MQTSSSITSASNRGGPTEVRLNRALPGLSYCQTLRRVVLSTTHETPTMTWSYSPCNIGVFLGSIVVSILPCHGSDPGSIPGRGALFREADFACLGELAQMVESKLRNQEVIGSILSRSVLFCPNGQKGRDKNETGGLEPMTFRFDGRRANRCTKTS